GRGGQAILARILRAPRSRPGDRRQGRGQDRRAAGLLGRPDDVPPARADLELASHSWKCRPRKGRPCGAHDCRPCGAYDCRPREGGDPVACPETWVPASAGTTVDGPLPQGLLTALELR